MQKIAPCLWFDGNAEEAATFYVSIFKNSRIGRIARYGKSGPGPEGSVVTVEFQLDGQDFLGLNGGPQFRFTEAVSFSVSCQTQAEVDHYWSRLTDGGGQEVECGWLKDKYGLSWQIVPAVLPKMIADPDPQKADRVMQALLKMKKLDIAGLEQAYRG